MMDLIAVAVMALCIAVGYRRGGLLDVLGLVALLMAYVASAVVAVPLAQLLVGHANLSVAASYAAGRLMGGVAIYAGLVAIALVVNRRLGRTLEGTVRPWNKGLGALTGLGWGLFFALALLFLSDVYVKTMPEAVGRVADWSRRSHLRTAVSRFNPADRFLLTDAIRLLKAARRDPAVLERLRQDPRFSRILAEAQVKRAMEDEALAEAFRKRNIAGILGNASFQALITDARLRKQLLSPQTRAALQEAAQ